MTKENLDKIELVNKLLRLKKEVTPAQFKVLVRLANDRTLMVLQWNSLQSLIKKGIVEKINDKKYIIK
tara:strand:- start:314 stop:517 length:204 start_codon:yes stop_codon:yes gene_type:complete